MKKCFFISLMCSVTMFYAQLKTVYSVTPIKNISCVNPTLINGKFYFAGNDPSISGLGSEFFISDSTEAGTLLVKDIHSTPFNGSNPESFTRLNATQCVFWAQDATNGKELWVTNGTSGGTNLVKDITPGSASNSYQYFINVGNEVYFMANDGTNGNELWKTDGTAPGTNMVKDINAFGNGMSIPANPYIKSIASIGNIVFFVANNGTSGSELWKTDGTSAGTVLVKDINPGSASSNPTNFLAVGNTLYFSATTASEGNELWKSDGTTAGTILVKDLNPLFAANTNPGYLTRLNNKIYFSGVLNSKATIFESDGTTAGTYSVYASSNFNTAFGRLTKVDTSFYFFESNTGTPSIYSLYKYDVVSNTANLIKSGMYGGSSGAGYQPTKESCEQLNGMLYFTFDNSTNGDELWQSDGTAAGTKMITDIGAGVLTSWIDFLIPVNNGINSRLYFTSTKKTGLLYIKADAVSTEVNSLHNNKISFSVYPNPAKGILNISITSEFNLNNTEVRITNLLGQEVFQSTINAKQTTISTSHLNSGIYFIIIESNGTTSNKKIIIE